MPKPFLIHWRKLPAAAFLGDAGLQSDWDRLNTARLDLPFLGADAVAAALNCFGRGDETLAVGAAEGRTVAMVMLEPDGALRCRSFQPSQLPLGAWVADGGLLLTDLCRSLLHGPLGICLGLSITQVDPLQSPRPNDDSDTRHSDYIDTAWLDLQGDFEAYWAARGKNLRQNLRKQRNKLAADGTVTHLQVLQQEGEMADAVARYGELESRGWKAGKGTAIHPDNAQGRFYTRLLQDAARRGEARVFEYRFGDRTVAMNLGLQRRGVLVVLKTTYDETMPKTLSPAALLREEELQHFFAEGRVSRIEYYGRLMEWHTKLTDQHRRLHHLTVYRWPWLKRLAERRRLPASANAAPSEHNTPVPTST